MNRIAEFRARARIKQNVLAAAIGWEQGRLSNYEAGRRVPSLNDSRAIVRALNHLGVVCSLDGVFPPEVDEVQAA